MKSLSGQAVCCVLIGCFMIWGVSHISASGSATNGSASSFAARPAPQGVSSPTPTPTATPSATPTPTATPLPNPQIDGEGSIDGGPNGGHPQFFIVDVENEQVTAKFLEGEFGYSDHRSHITFTTGKIQTVTINGNQGAFTGLAKIGGKKMQTVQFTVTVTANQSPATGDTFSITLSNGYSASGNLRDGHISILQVDPVSDH